MNTNQLAIATAAVALIGGIAVAWSGFHVDPAPVSARFSIPPWAWTSVLAALATFAISGWFLPSVAIGGLCGWAALSRRNAHSRQQFGVERVEALASWVENVRDVLQAGNQPVGAIGATTETCPAVIRPQVTALFARLSAGQPAEIVLRRFADDMDDPLADLVAVGLLIAVSRGAETESVLSTLATQSRSLADRRRLVEAERAPMQREVLMVSIVMCLLLGTVFVFARSSYLNAYDRFEGQVFLAVVLCGYGGMLIWVARLARFPRPARFLTLRAGDL